MDAGGPMSTTLAALGQFGDGVDFIFKSRESQGGGVRIGGPGQLTDFGLTHLKVSAISMAFAIGVATPIGLYLGHKGRGQLAVSAISNVGRAVPILALIAFFIAYLGIGLTNVVAALTLLAIPPIFTNAYVGANQVDPEIVDAAEGMGLTGFQVVTRVRLPLAMSTYFGGVRTAAVGVLATATIAPLANVQTLGEPIINQAVYGLSGAIGAAIVVAIMTVILDAGMAALQRAVTPKGIKLGRPQQAGKRFSISRPLRREQAT
jgi:osmoprotectant transport system permease protein